MGSKEEAYQYQQRETGSGEVGERGREKVMYISKTREVMAKRQKQITRKISKGLEEREDEEGLGEGRGEEVLDFFLAIF